MNKYGKLNQRTILIDLNREYNFGDELDSMIYIDIFCILSYQLKKK